MKSLRNKTIVITGASSGIGRALALQLSKENCNLVLAARRIEKLSDLRVEIKIINPRLDPLIIKTDVCLEKDVINLFDESISKFDKIDVLVNNAGKGLPAKVHETSKEDWDSIIHTNLDGVFLASREAVKHMLENKEGQIVTVCSIAGLYGAPGYSAYCASKHAVAGFKRALWLELRKKGIKISTIYPARINTEFFDKYTEKPNLSQMISPEDIADYIVTIIKRNKIKRVLKRIRLLYKRIRNII